MVVLMAFIPWNVLIETITIMNEKVKRTCCVFPYRIQGSFEAYHYSLIITTAEAVKLN